MDKLISYVVLDPSQWFFLFDEEIIITWTQEKKTTLCDTVHQAWSAGILAPHGPII